MEVLFVSHKYPPSTGGMEKQSFELIHGVAAILHTHMIVKTPSENIVRFFLTLNKRIVQKITQYPTIKIIHFNDGLLAAMSLRHSGYEHLQKTVTIHGLDIVFPFGYFQQKIIPRFNQFDRIIAVSQATAEAAIRRGIDPDKIAVIPNGVDHTLANNIAIPLPELAAKYPTIDFSRPYFMSVGRAVKRKGFSWLIKNVILPMEQDVQFIMVGPFQQQQSTFDKIIRFLPYRYYRLLTLFLGYPTDQYQIQRLLKKYNNRKIVHLGKVPLDDLNSLLCHSTAFLMPNIKVYGDMEGFGLVCLEASIAGTLVVASKIDGITSAISHRKNGLLLPPKNADMWQFQLQNILEKPLFFKNLALEFKTHTLENYSWTTMAQQYADLFKEIERK